MSDDKLLIQKLGGPAKVALLLGFSKNKGVQRVHNWLSRGIPSKIKLQYPQFFLAPSKLPTKPK